MRAVRTTLVLALAAAACVTSCQPAGASGRAGGAGGRARGAGGTLAWARKYTGLQPHGNYPAAVAVSPSGSTVFVTGTSDHAGEIAHGAADYATVAYSARTGARLWASRYNGPGNGGDFAYAMALSPSGRTVFVTGSSFGSNATRMDYATIAYSARTGARLWASRYNGPASLGEAAYSVAVSPDGSLVFVTGSDATIGYVAATGAQAWVTGFSGQVDGSASGSSLAVSPDGETVYVTGQNVAATGPAVVTNAYRAATGAMLWSRQYSPGNLNGQPALAVSPDGRALFVMGSAGDASLIAYQAATGALMWVSRFTGRFAEAHAIAVGRGGAMVYVTGCADGTLATGTEYATAAYSAATGARMWLRHYANTKVKYACAHTVAVSPSGARVYVSGTNGQSSFGTIAYAARTGRQIWLRRYGRFGRDFVFVSAAAVSPDSRSVFITGSDSKKDYVTVAYRA